MHEQGDGHRGGPGFTAASRGARVRRHGSATHIVAIAIVMQSAPAWQTNRHALAVQEGIDTGKVWRERPATHRVRRARLRAVVSLVRRGSGRLPRIARPAS